MKTKLLKELKTDPQFVAEVLIKALPFIRSFVGQSVVVKVGGEIATNSELSAGLVQDLLLMEAVGVQIVLCHGGGPQISQAMEKFNKEPIFKDGLRVTDAETLDIASMVLLGDVNRKFVAQLNAQSNVAVGLSGLDGRLFTVSPAADDLGFVGDIEEVSTDSIFTLLEAGYLPVVASLGVDEQGSTYNINADAAAGELAAALGAEKLIILTNVAGIYRSFEDKNSLISEISCSELQELHDGDGLSAGMLPKVEAVLNALQNGVHSAHILDGRMLHALLLEVFTPEGVGTMITSDS